MHQDVPAEAATGVVSGVLSGVALSIPVSIDPVSIEAVSPPSFKMPLNMRVISLSALLSPPVVFLFCSAGAHKKRKIDVALHMGSRCGCGFEQILGVVDIVSMFIQNEKGEKEAPSMYAFDIGARTSFVDVPGRAGKRR